jgi:hypothetical protein
MNQENEKKLSLRADWCQPGIGPLLYAYGVYGRNAIRDDDKDRPKLAIFLIPSFTSWRAIAYIALAKFSTHIPVCRPNDRINEHEQRHHLFRITGAGPNRVFAMKTEELKKVIIVVKYDGEKFVAFPTKPKGFAVPPRGEGPLIIDAVSDLVCDLLAVPFPAVSELSLNEWRERALRAEAKLEEEYRNLGNWNDQ